MNAITICCSCFQVS